MARVGAWPLRLWALRRELAAMFLAWRNPRTPTLVKAIGVLAVVYLISPIDLAPDFIPLGGLLDDVIVVPALLALMRRLIPQDIMDASRARTDAWSAPHGSAGADEPRVRRVVNEAPGAPRDQQTAADAGPRPYAAGPRPVEAGGRSRLSEQIDRAAATAGRVAVAVMVVGGAIGLMAIAGLVWGLVALMR